MLGMSDDWQWFWAGEGTRDRILRDEIGGLQASLSSASARTHRLSSQLAMLSGSIESRLSALSRAFDAYVELGDVREELTAYAEPAAVRREVIAAVEAIAGGRAADAVDPHDLDYWLPYAMNAVSALVADREATDDLARARSLAPESDLFVVAACGALGHGAAVADLLADVLTTDETLTGPQQAIWRAVTTGAYGNSLPDSLAAAWRPQLERVPTASWSAWVEAHGSTPSAGISWLRAAITETPLSTGVPTNELRTLVTQLIQRGMPAEEELLRRARELRALIEQPNTARSAADADAEAPTVLSEVQRALLDPTTDPTIRAALRQWAAPAMVEVVDALVSAATAVPPAEVTVRNGGSEVVVTAAGVDEDSLQAGVTRLQEAYVFSTRPLLGWSVGAGLAALLTVLLAVVGSGWAWLFGIFLVVGAVGAIQQVVARRATEQARSEALSRLRQSVDEAAAQVASTERQRTALLAQLTAEAADLRGRLTSLEQVQPRW